MYIDYVRIYQEEGKELLTCDPRMYTPAGYRYEAGVLTNVAGYETTGYIQEHLEPYMNVNMTVSFLFQTKVRVLTFQTWSETDFPWPKNKLMHGCK